MVTSTDGLNRSSKQSVVRKGDAFCTQTERKHGGLTMFKLRVHLDTDKYIDGTFDSVDERHACYSKMVSSMVDGDGMFEVKSNHVCMTFDLIHVVFIEEVNDD